MGLTPKHKKTTLLIIILFLVGFFSIAQGAFNEKINYQGKLTDSSNVAVSDSNYDIVFRLYTVAGGDSAIWTESWTNAALFTDSSTTFTNDGCDTGVDKMAYATDTNESSLAAGQLLWNTTKKESAVIESVSITGSGGYICFYDSASTWATSDTVTNRIYIKNGLFSVMLGTVSSLSSINFNQTLFLGVTVGADSEMKPRKVLGAAPAAFEAKQLGGYTWESPGTIGSADANTGAFTTLSATYSGASTALTVTQSGAGDIVNFFDGGTEVFTILNGGNVGIGVADPDTRLEVYYGGTQLKLSFDGTDNATFAVDTNGDLTITPSGDEIFTSATSVVGSAALTVKSTAADLTLTNLTSGNIAFTSLGNITETIAAAGTYTVKDATTNFLAVNSSGAITLTPTSGQDLSVSLATTGDFVVNTDDFFIDTSEAKIGIGTATPSETLEVIGSLKVDTVGSITQTSDNDFNAGTAVNTTVSSGSVTLFELVCGSYSVTFTYKGSSVTYGTVSHNSECWLDRNLGASRVAQAYNDYLAYGDLFQWGRLDDEHQSITWTSSTTGTPDHGSTDTLSTTDVPGDNLFIKNANPDYDWRTPKNDALWQGVSGTNNPCPSGWRIPTETELNTERLSWSENNRAGAYASPLKLTAAGYRHYSNASLYDVGSSGGYWSSTISTASARRLHFYSDNASMSSNNRAYGFSVRCIKD